MIIFQELKLILVKQNWNAHDQTKSEEMQNLWQKEENVISSAKTIGESKTSEWKD